MSGRHENRNQLVRQMPNAQRQEEGFSVAGKLRKQQQASHLVLAPVL